MNSFSALLLSNIVLAAGLATIVYAITKKWRSPHLAHGLWLLVLVKLVTPPLVDVPLPQWMSPVAITQVVEVIETPSTPIPTETIQELHIRPIPETLPSVASSEPLPLEHTEPEAIESESADIRALPASPTFSLPTWPQTLFGVWCIGLIGLVLTAARRHWLLLRVIAKATPLQGPLREEAQAITRQLGLRHCPELRVTTARVCPLVSAGWRNQTVLLPAQLLDQLTPEQCRSILTHEFSHIRRHDHLVRRFELLVLAIHWWNPVAWLASRQLRQAEERCCDAMVVSTLPDGRRCYGEALLQTIEFLTEGPTLSTIGASGFGEFTFSQRIETIMKMEVSKGMSWLSRIAVLVVAVSVLPFAGAEVSKEDDDQAATDVTVKEPTAEQGPMIRGTVVNEAGKPVPGASIRAHFPGWKNTTGKADSQGRFALKSQADRFGRATLWAKGPNETLGFAKVEWEIKEDDAPPPQQVTLESPRKIDVRVVSRQGKPIAGTKIAVNSDYETAARATTNEKGLASLVVPKSAELQFILADAAEKGIDYFLYRRPGTPKSDPYQLPQDHSEQIVFTLSPTRSIMIRAVDHNGVPLPGVNVHPWLMSLFKKGGRANLGNLLMKQTDESGLVKYDNIPVATEKKTVGAERSTGAITFWVRKEGYIATERTSVDPRTSPDVITATLVPLVPVIGRVIQPDGAPVGGIEVNVVGTGYSIDGFRETVKTNADGSFQCDVHPNQYYLFVAGNDKWVSPLLKRVILEKTIDPVEITLLRATRVYGRVTTEVDDDPVRGEHVSLYQREREDGTRYLSLPKENRLPNPTGSRKSIAPRVVKHASTDDQGNFEFFVGPGEFYTFAPRNELGPKFTIDDQEELEANMQTKRVFAGKLMGRVVLKSAPDQGVADVKVTGYPGNLYSRHLLATTDATGRFEAPRGDYQQTVGAMTKDYKLGAIGLALEGAEELVLKLVPTATLRGTLFDDETGQPVVNREINVSYSVEYEGGTFTEAFRRRGQTDKSGRFELSGVVPNERYHIQVVTDRDNEGNARAWREVTTITPRRSGVINVGELRLPRPTPTPARNITRAFKDQDHLQARVNQTLADASLTYGQVLLVAGDPKTDATKQFFQARFGNNRRLLDALPNYSVIGVDASNKKYLNGHGIGALEKDEVILAILKSDGQLAVKTRLKSLEVNGKLDRALLAEFLHAHQLALPDADKKMSAAFAKASREDKRVIVQVGGPSSVASVLLSRYLDSQKELLAKDYVYVKLDSRMPHAGDVIEKLRVDAKGSIPWMMILSADGTAQVTSDSDEGNVGYPNTKRRRAHFKQMIRSTRKRLTDAEIATLVNALKKQP